MKNKSIKKMTGLSLLTAVTVVLALLSNVTIGTVNLNLALIPIVVGACIYGPSGGLFLGIVDGALTCVAPSTLSLFMTHNIPSFHIISDFSHSWLPNQGSRAEFQIHRKHSRIACLHFVGFLEMRRRSFHQSLRDIHDPEIQELLVHHQW